MTDRHREYHVCGPPGTGKTTWVAKQAKRAVEKHGAERVMILSLTKAAARAIGERDTGLSADRMGTMHSFCFHLLGTPKLMGKKEVETWNKEHPHWALSPAVLGTSGGWLDPGADIFSSVYQTVDRKRHKLDEPLTSYESEFLGAFTFWKREHGFYDFTQLIEDVLHQRRTPDPQPAVLIADEYQDLSNLELSVLRLWGDEADDLVMVGDFAQSVYDFHGASRAYAERVPDVVLEQSHRVPRRVWDVAKRLLDRMSKKPSAYLKPREEEGEFQYGPSLKFPEFYLNEIASRPDESFMFIASCGYMLNALIDRLRMEGIPYWNPYAPTEGRWNPLKLNIDGKTTTPQRVLAYLNGSNEWTVGEFKLWQPLFVGIWKRGFNNAIELLRDDDPWSILSALLKEITKPEAMTDILTRQPNVLLRYAAAKYEKTLTYLVRLIELNGKEVLEKEPRILLGTIHSVKGGEADNVIVFPDLSPSWFELMQQDGWEGRDSVLRLFYVALTRARKRLIVGDPATRFYMEGL
jgi:Superfamily I DNA and RNA helicases